MTAETPAKDAMLTIAPRPERSMAPISYFPDVRPDAPIELDGIDVGEERRHGAVRGVVEGGVETPKGLNRLGDEMLDRRCIADIGRNGEGSAPGRADLGRDGIERARIAGREDDDGARLRERPCRRRADAPAGARYERNLPFEWRGHPSSPLRPSPERPGSPSPTGATICS